MNPLNLFSERGLKRSGAAGPSGAILHDGDGYLLAWGAEKPADATPGYAAGCLFINRGLNGVDDGLYINVGDHDSCEFVANGGAATGG